MKKLLDMSGTPKIKKNVVLAIFLSLIIIVNVGTFALFLMNIIGIAERSAYLPGWMVIFSAIICLGNVLCALAAWYWRRWGVIGYCALSLTSYIVTVITTQNFSNFFGLVGAIILVILIIPYWKSMIPNSLAKSSASKIDNSEFPKVS